MGIRYYPDRGSSNGGGGFPDWVNYNIHLASVQGIAATMTVLGYNQTNIGAPAAVTPTSASASASIQRVQYSPLSGATVGVNMQSPLYWRGNAANLGGYILEFVCCHVTNVKATGRWAMGLFSGGAASISLAGDPSAFTDCVFFGHDSGDANFQIMSNDAAGACTKVNLGASFAKTNSNRIYRVRFTAGANGSSIAYSVNELVNGISSSGTLGTNLPTNTVFLNPQFTVGGGTGVGSNVGFLSHVTGQIPY